MSLKDMLENAMKKTNEFIQTSNIKEKVVEMKDRAMDKIQGIDNPEHYTMVEGFTLFTTPLQLVKNDSIEMSDNIEAYSRLVTLFLPNETIKQYVKVNMKRNFLLVWTNLDRIIIVMKECYKIYKREEIHTFKVIASKNLNLEFQINEYLMSSSEKSKLYLLIREYCYEKTEDYVFQPYSFVTKSLNFYEKLKCSLLTKENQAIEENKKLSVLFGEKEFSMVSVYGKYMNQSYILSLTTEAKLYLICETAYTIIPISNIHKIDVMNKGIFSSEFFMDNYFFTGCGPDDNALRLVDYINHPELFEERKEEVLKENVIFMDFPFEGATSYQTPGNKSLVVEMTEENFVLETGYKEMEMHPKSDFNYYELIKIMPISREDMWSSGVGKTVKETIVSKEEAIMNYEDVKVRIFLKTKEELAVEIPLIVMKVVKYNETEEVVQPGSEAARMFIEQLDRFKERRNI